VKRRNYLLEDFPLLFQGIIILFLILAVGLSISKLGIDSLTGKKEGKEEVGLALLEKGSYQLTFLGESFSTPPAWKIGEIKNDGEEIILCLGQRQWHWRNTLQIGKVEVLWKGMVELFNGEGF